MLIKIKDDDSELLRDLEQRAAGTGPAARQAANELRIRQAGHKGERESAYLIDFHFERSPNWAVIHDLRLEHDGRVAQIDHLLINRWLEIYVLETKHFHAGLKITENGEFLRWNAYRKTYEGMASPLEQNERHIAVLSDAVERLDWPQRMGMRIAPVFHSLVLVAPGARIDRSKGFDSSRVIKADLLRKQIDKDFQSEGTLSALFKTTTKLVSGSTVADVGKLLAALHRPLQRNPHGSAVETATASASEPSRASAVRIADAATPAAGGYAAAPRQQRIEPTLDAPSPAARAAPSPRPAPAQTPAPARQRVDPPPPVEPPPAAAVEPPPLPAQALEAAPACKHCGGVAGGILYGKFGYYFKCDACGDNTAIRFACQPGHKPRLRKDGLSFYRECADCRSSALYHRNRG